MARKGRAETEDAGAGDGDLWASSTLGAGCQRRTDSKGEASRTPRASTPSLLQVLARRGRGTRRKATLSCRRAEAFESRGSHRRCCEGLLCAPSARARTTLRQSRARAGPAPAESDADAFRHGLRRGRVTTPPRPSSLRHHRRRRRLLLLPLASLHKDSQGRQTSPSPRRRRPRRASLDA